ncbi:MAG TPA: tyrosine--tRNA ligase [Candidatus Saccharibacteria bacterium]|nr:tyrosine--tRNA ligase [Candidatus Saccharibacteria bacterium]
MNTMTLSEELKWRGFVNQTTFKDISVLDTPGITFYWGVDPSADSMQIGNLAAGMMARHFIKNGHKAILLGGGATGTIGDPDGKSEERSLLSLDQIAHNKEAISKQYEQVFNGMSFKVVDNYDWFKDLGYLEFLRAVGKHVPMRQMLGREFVQSRLSEEGSGISYAEFSYSLIQGYDFLHLYKEYGVTLQLCGADQWGNSIAGVELIRRIAGAEAHIWSSPLVINRATGKKFGKTEGGAIWLDDKKTSVYKFYQFWLNCDDEGVEEYMKIYTDLDKETIDSIMKEHNESRGLRIAQKRLAYESTVIVHGTDRADAVVRISDVLFGSGSYSELTQDDFQMLKQELPTVESHVGAELTELLVAAQLATSKGDARRFLQSNAIYINGQQLPLEKQHIDKTDVINGYAIIRRGKNATALLEIK